MINLIKKAAVCSRLLQKYTNSGESELIAANPSFQADNYSGRGKFMPLSLKSKILETPGFLVTDYLRCFHYEFGR
jgi:hypothetical protein